jgi:hypothetical protein
VHGELHGKKTYKKKVDASAYFTARNDNITVSVCVSQRSARTKRPKNQATSCKRTSRVWT